MKKITKFSKIFLALVMIFSQLSSVVTVLAEEIVSKPLFTTFKANISEDGNVTGYDLTFISENVDYEAEKEYKVELKTSFTYLNGDKETLEPEVLTMTGEELNDTRTRVELDPISEDYNGTFNLSLTVKDNAMVIYEVNIPYIVTTIKSGLVGSLNNGLVLPSKESVGTVSTGEYNVNESNSYTQSLIVLPGELSPNGYYRVSKDNVQLFIGSGNDLLGKVFDGTITPVDGTLGGSYNTSDVITIEELDDNMEVINTISYTYNANVNYDVDNDMILSDLYGVNFKDGYLYEEAIGYGDTDVISKISDFTEGLVNTDIVLTIFDENGNELDLTDPSVLDSEIKNNYKLVFKSGFECSYTTVIMGDNNYDNSFDSDDMLPTMEDYLNDNRVLSMDVVSSDGDEKGLITFEDIMNLNMRLHDIYGYDKNSNLSLLLSDMPKELFVGDTFEVQVIVNSDNVVDYINGINAVVNTSDNIKLIDMSFNKNLIGTSNDNSFVAAGDMLGNDDVVISLTFMATSEGEGIVSLTGSIGQNDNITSFEELTGNVNIVRNVSSNNNLSSLGSSVGTFDSTFDKDVTVYTLTVPYDTEEVILFGGLEDVNSSVDGLIKYTLTEDKTTAIITVTAEDGSVKTYTVYIIKEAKPVEEVVVSPVSYNYSDNNYLKSLEIDGYEIDFDKMVNEYKINVKSDVTSLDIVALAEDSRARVEITGNEKFKKGENVVTVTVTAEDGSTREYKIKVNKESGEKEAITEIDNSSNTAEKIVIIILIVLVVLGLLYLIFKKDEEEVISVEPKKDSKSNSKKK